MGRRTTYIKTKQEISLNKNFSLSVNQMIEHIENIDKFNRGEGLDEKYALFKGRKFEYITLEFNPNSGKHILAMKEEVPDLSYMETKLIYIREISIEKKKNTQLINSYVDSFENIKLEDKHLTKDLISSYAVSGSNTFFNYPKEICIVELSNTIHSELNAKKIYTMLLNKINLIDDEIKDKEQYTSKHQMSKIKNRDKILNKEFEKHYKKIIHEIVFGYEVTEDISQSIYKEKLEELETINKDIDNIFFAIKLKEAQIIDEQVPTQIKLQVYSSSQNSYTIQELQELETQLKHKKKILELETNHLRLRNSALNLLLLYDFLEEYIDIRLFEEKKQYKKTATLIKKFYQDKIQNIKKYSGQYDKYIHNRANRYKKVKEIEYLDQLIFKNLDVMEQLLYQQSGTDLIKMIDSESEGLYADKLLAEIIIVLEIKYKNDKYLLNKKLNKLEKIGDLIFYLIGKYQVQYVDEEMNWNLKELTKIKQLEQEVFFDNEENEMMSQEELEQDIVIGSLFGE